ncbi:MAG: hypothetical protein AMXMBFR48_05120 [Ignavibacteriales bacterium]
MLKVRKDNKAIPEMTVNKDLPVLKVRKVTLDQKGHKVLKGHRDRKGLRVRKEIMAQVYLPG